MNYKQARQRKTDSRWDFTNMNDGLVRPLGYCCGAPDPEAFAKLGIHVSEEERQRWQEHHDKYHTDGHATPEEACACYRQYLLDNRLRLSEEAGVQRPCQVCEVWTTQRVVVDVYHNYVLCEEHRTREHVEQLFPAIHQIIAS